MDKSGSVHFSDKPSSSTLDGNHDAVLPNKLIERTKSIRIFSAKSITLKVRGLLQDKSFKALNSYLAELQSNADLDVAKEQDLYAAYYAFRIEDKSYQPLFDAWVESTPHVHSAYLARSRYYYGLGWMARGEEWASETKKKQMKEMIAYFNKAMLDVTAAFKINDTSMVLYTTLINIANVFGKKIEAQAAARRALEINPASFVVRVTYLHSITPRWGGSYKQMAAFIISSQRYADENPKLKWLAGSIYADIANMSSIRGAPNAALEEYTKALRFGEYHPVIYQRGKINYRLKKYQEALEDFNRAIEIYPEDAEYYYRRAKTQIKLHDISKALIDIKYAARLNPYDQSIKKTYEWLLLKEAENLSNTDKKYLEIDKYNSALAINPSNADTYRRRARVYIAQNKNELALKDLDTAIALEPNNIDHYHLIDFVLAKGHSWKKIISYWDKFIALNPDNSRAYLERGGAYYRMGDLKSGVRDAKKSADLGDLVGKEMYERYRRKVKK